MTTIHTLLIHHLEEQWREGLAKFGENPEELVLKVIDFLESPAGCKINNVILTKAFEDGLEDLHAPLVRYLTDRKIPFVQEPFPYGEVRESFEGNESAVLIPSTKKWSDEDDVVCIQSWHQDLATHASVSLCGAFEGECIRDAEDVLDHVRGGDYSRLESLIVGTGTFYEYHIHPGSMIAKAQSLQTELQDLIDEDGDFPNARSKAQAKRIVSEVFREKDFKTFCRYQHCLDDLFDDASPALFEVIETALESGKKRQRVIMHEPAFG